MCIFSYSKYILRCIQFLFINFSFILPRYRPCRDSIVMNYFIYPKIMKWQKSLHSKKVQTLTVKRIKKIVKKPTNPFLPHLCRSNHIYIFECKCCISRFRKKYKKSRENEIVYNEVKLLRTKSKLLIMLYPIFIDRNRNFDWSTSHSWNHFSFFNKVP